MSERRRKTDKWVIGAMVLCFICTAVCVLVVAPTTLLNRGELIDQQKGREIAIATSCGIQEAIIRGGERALRTGILLPGDQLREGKYIPGPLAKTLRREIPGYPSYEARVQRSTEAARAYRQEIANAVIKASRQTGSDTIPLKKDGSLDCEAYVQLTSG